MCGDVVVWKVQFYSDKALDRVFIGKLLYFLVSRGVKYNKKHKAAYFIFSQELERDIEYTEKTVGESTEKLAEILERYFQYDLKTTSFTIYLDYCMEPAFNFELSM